MAINAGSINIYPWVFFSQLLHRGYLIRQSVIAHVAIISIVKFLGPHRVSHAIDLDDDEAEFGERLRVAARRRERTATDTPALWARIDVIDDRIFLLLVEIRRRESKAVDSFHRLSKVESPYLRQS